MFPTDTEELFLWITEIINQLKANRTDEQCYSLDSSAPPEW